ncbi:MAG: hypothetical protein PF487_04240 [Bacteroidales bacterium]|jgi:hypothetical protein|nr:hypothetical protein [Bacteroidales bacterium]
MKKLVQIVLAIAIVVLAYFLWESIQNPIRFNKEKSKRYSATIKQLKNIRTAQLAYKDVNGNFIGSFDTLINFIENDSMSIIKAIGNIPDSLLESGWTEKLALKEGLIIRDTVKVCIKDSLFKDNFTSKTLWKVPFTEKDSFQMGINIIETASKVKVKVFEAKVSNNILLHGMDKQLIINLNDRMSSSNNFPGLKVGDLKEPNNNAGNWE